MTSKSLEILGARARVAIDQLAAAKASGNPSAIAEATLEGHRIAKAAEAQKAEDAALDAVRKAMTKGVDLTPGAKPLNTGRLIVPLPR
jgi:hypothetical protein